MKIAMKYFLCACLLLVATSTFAQAGSCGLHQTIAIWNLSKQNLPEGRSMWDQPDTENVLKVLEHNLLNNFHYCSIEERQQACNWTDARLAELVNWVPPDTDMTNRMWLLQTRLREVLHSSK